MKSEPRKQQLTVTLSDCNHLAHVLVLGKYKNLCVTVQFSLCFILNLRAIFYKYKARVAYIRRGNLTEGFLRYEFAAPGGLYSERLMHEGA